MSGTGPLPYLEYCGVEVANAARTVQYIRRGLMQSAGGQIELGSGDLCGVLYRLHGTGPGFLSPALDPAPWYDAAEPGSTSFLGLIMLGLKGYDSTISRSVVQRISGLGGGTFGGQHRLPRTWTFRAAMISSDDVGAEYGLRWLTSVLQQGCDGCGTCDLAVRLACPPADGSNDDLGKWTSYDVALVDGPHEVEQFINQYGDGDNLAGCRDVVIVEWTIQAGNPFLYKPAVTLASATATREGDCVFVPDMQVTGSPITDAMRELGIEGDGLAPDSGYGVWPGSRNLHPNGSAEIPFTGTDWASVNGTIGRTTAQRKFGSYSVVFAAPGSVANEGMTARADLALADQLPAATGVNFSVWLKGAVGGEQLSLTPSFHNTDTSSTTGSAQAITLTNDWARYSVKLFVGAGKTADRASLFIGTRSGATTAFQCYADGLQIEVSSLPTPYIDTEGAPATRDPAQIITAAATDILDPFTGWIAFRVRMGWGSSASPASLSYLFDWTSGGSEFYTLAYNSTAHQWEFTRGTSGHNVTVTVPDTFAEGDEVVVIATWDSQDFFTGGIALSVDGAPLVSASAPFIPDPLEFEPDAYLGSKRSNSVPIVLSGFISSNLLWYGASRAKTLTNADVAEIAARAPYDPTPQVFSFDIGLPGLETMTWSADTAAIDTAVANGICDFLFGPPRQVLCQTVEPPERGVVGAVFTLTSQDGFGGVVFQAWPDCNDLKGDAPLEMQISGVPAGCTVVVDCSRHTVTVTDADGNETDGQYLLTIPDGRGLEWIEIRDCDPLSCVCAAVQPCAVGTFTVTIGTQAREG